MKAKKVILTIAAMALVAVVAVSASFAYLTSKPKAATNTFTIGKIEITLDECAIKDVYGEKDADKARVTDNTYKLIPDHKYDKDPIVHVQPGSEKSILFVKIENGIALIEAETETAENGYKNIDAQIKANGWTQLTLNGVDYQVYYKLADEVAAGEGVLEVDYPVFKEFKIADDAVLYSPAVTDDPQTTDVNEAKPEVNYDGKTIIVTAYAIQQDGFVAGTAITPEEALAAWNALNN